MDPKRLDFKPIDLDAHASTCVEFRRDSFLCSFGVDRFFDEAGPDGEHYIEHLRSRMNTFPDGYVHAWDGDRIVGQMEMQILDTPRRGYVNLFYLVEEMRGAGVSGELQAYAMAFMRCHGVQTAQLSVSPTNARALAYYRRHGWKDLGPRPGRHDVTLMECAVPATLSRSRHPSPATPTLVRATTRRRIAHHEARPLTSMKLTPRVVERRSNSGG
ncbi:MAG: GNAT family N-acetyltransferase [Candidatus Eisenbacteria bacterium]